MPVKGLKEKCPQKDIILQGAPFLCFSFFACGVHLTGDYCIPFYRLGTLGAGVVVGVIVGRIAGKETRAPITCSYKKLRAFV